MLKVDDAWLERAEQQYPGLRKTVAYYEAQTVAGMSAVRIRRDSGGVIGPRRAQPSSWRRPHRRPKLLPNGHPADFYCGACHQFFDAP